MEKVGDDVANNKKLDILGNFKQVSVGERTNSKPNFELIAFNTS